MNNAFKISTVTAIIIYLILASGVIAIIIAYKMTPKDARSITIDLNGGSKTIVFENQPPDNPLHYKIDDAYVRVYAKGKLYLYPIVNIVKLEVEP